MNRLFVPFVAAVLTGSLSIAAAQQSATQAEKLMASAQNKAAIDGDLRGAIEDYKRALAAAGSNRALAAQALLRMAECHQKLGDAEAQAIYQRLVRDYADQKEALVVARARFVPSAPMTRARGDWSVWAGRDADGFGTITSDGRFLTYTDWDHGASLALRDLTTGTNYRLTSSGETQFSAISRDGRQVAYEWRDTSVSAQERRHEIRVAKLHGTSISEARRLFQNDDVSSSAPYDWSPDGKWIAVGLNRTDGTRQIGLLGVQDGSLRVLKSLDWSGTGKILFSPDGKYIAYDLMVTDSRDERHVFVMSVDGSPREATVAADPSQNVVMGWSPDGQHVLFSSNRSGSFGLWAVPVKDGKSAGPPLLLKADVSSSWSLGLTAAGTMYVWKYASPIYVQTSRIDLTSSKLALGPATFQRFIASRGRPAWSADGKHLAYQSCNPLGAGPCTLWIRSMETGELRELKVKLGYFFFPQWSPDGRELLVNGRDLKGRNNGFYRIDVQTGDVELLVSPPPGNSPQWGADGTRVYSRRDAAIIERDLGSGVEREVARIPSASPGGMALSPDRRYVAYQSDEPTGRQTLFVMPLVGGAPKAVLQVSAPERLVMRFHWTADGRKLIAAKQVGEAGRRELWMVDAGGGQPRKLDIDVTNWMIEDGFHFDPAGQQVAFVASAGQPGLEIRALENFLPKPVATK